MNETNQAPRKTIMGQRPERFYYEAFNDALDGEQLLKPWADLSDP